jgi:hypothetical protein
MSKTEEVIESYLEKLKDPDLAHAKFVEFTERIRELRSLQDEQ